MELAGPAPAGWRRDVAVALATALKRRAPARLWVTGDAEIAVANLARPRPDVVVVFDDGFDRQAPRLRPAQVLLVAEVAVEPRAAGPASAGPAAGVAAAGLAPHDDAARRAYAGAGIEHYWRVEIAPQFASVRTFRLADGEAYTSTGVFGPDDVVAAPGLAWADVRVGDLPVPPLG